MLLSITRLAVKPSKFDHDEINIHSSATQHYGRHTALRGMLAALGFTPLFTRGVERLSAGLAPTGGASAAYILETQVILWHKGLTFERTNNVH